MPKVEEQITPQKYTQSDDSPVIPLVTNAYVNHRQDQADFKAAVRDGDAAILATLLVARSSRGYNSFDPVSEAIFRNDVAALELLLHAGYSAETDVNGRLPLQLAVSGATKISEAGYRMTELLLQHGCRPDDTSPREGAGVQKLTPLMLAAEKMMAPVLDLLLSYGADPNRRDANGRTALHIVCEQTWIQAGAAPLIQLANLGDSMQGLLESDLMNLPPMSFPLPLGFPTLDENVLPSFPTFAWDEKLPGIGLNRQNDSELKEDTFLADAFNKLECGKAIDVFLLHGADPTISDRNGNKPCDVLSTSESALRRKMMHAECWHKLQSLSIASSIPPRQDSIAGPDVNSFREFMTKGAGIDLIAEFLVGPAL
eukprot:CAMPEP_0197661098 /NCGR_PEP_ID=MMETSP1338-20131121/51250_1 /TAXON_ID=43686 ORGANISM="Pelagodinium beii, Strain RCC1491" /NCGR_SAMPLE_ID=MMETSP1338 /ASSEMBLY_ACC=CAM_ASM_000754 /LENGTH=369 /DNA_ID=CAMNT_0043238587 /DNA_START=105 /DNA_END=1215 /DNA_ORIENTATION=+